jgi:hypothetical protein
MRSVARADSLRVMCHACSPPIQAAFAALSLWRRDLSSRSESAMGVRREALREILRDELSLGDGTEWRFGTQQICGSA